MGKIRCVARQPRQLVHYGPYLLSIKKTTRIFGISRSEIYRRLASGDIIAKKLRSAVEEAEREWIRCSKRRFPRRAKLRADGVKLRVVRDTLQERFRCGCRLGGLYGIVAD